MTLNLMYDATHENIPHLPQNATYAGYSTGSGGVPWTVADWKKFPDAVRIDQDPNATDPTADVLDVERGAATPNVCARWSRQAIADFHNGARPGQRSPLIYMSASEVTPVVNALNAGGIRSGVGLWVANWNLNDSQAVAEVVAASGPFPVQAVQFRNAGAYDISVVSVDWLTHRSVKPPPPPPSNVTPHIPPGQWSNAQTWTWRTARLTGVGLDNRSHEWDYNPTTGQWTRAS